MKTKEPKEKKTGYCRHGIMFNCRQCANDKPEPKRKEVEPVKPALKVMSPKEIKRAQHEEKEVNEKFGKKFD